MLSWPRGLSCSCARGRTLRTTSSPSPVGGQSSTSTLLKLPQLEIYQTKPARETDVIARPAFSSPSSAVIARTLLLHCPAGGAPSGDLSPEDLEALGKYVNPSYLQVRWVSLAGYVWLVSTAAAYGVAACGCTSTLPTPHLARTAWLPAPQPPRSPARLPATAGGQLGQAAGGV